MREALSLAGIAASRGYAEGPLHRLDLAVGAYVRKTSAAAESAALTDAVATAVARVAALVAATSGDSADILEFQLAMLQDDALSGPALDLIAEGRSAWDAWRSVMDGEIAGYEISSDAYFRARAADLKDIRDQVLRALGGGTAEAMPPGAILFGEDIAPTRFLETDWSKGGGIALMAGSSASHVAMLARARGVPMVVGLGAAAEGAAGLALLDAESGRIVLGGTEADIARFRAARNAYLKRAEAADRFLAGPAVTADGTEVQVHVNIADPADTDGIDIATCDGVGLMRTEFLFGKGLPDEETQYRAYRKVLEWADSKPVTIRTVDAGGDKPVAGFTVAEGNPFLGLRGIRLSLARPDIFRVQIRALLRAAAHGNLKVMFPMIAVPAEYARAAALFAEESEALASAGIAHAMPPLGIMVEVPSVAIAPEAFADAAFFSIGSNDLTQYVMAAARDNAAVAALNDVRNPAVLRLIGDVAAFGATHDIPVSLCGDAGGDPAAIPVLLAAGLRVLSAASAQLAAAKAAVAEASL